MLADNKIYNYIRNIKKQATLSGRGEGFAWLDIRGTGPSVSAAVV